MNFIIEYTVKSTSGHVLKQGTIRAKNRASEFEAKVKTEAWLKKKHSDFGSLIIHGCREENPFGDIFGFKSPFGF